MSLFQYFITSRGYWPVRPHDNGRGLLFFVFSPFLSCWPFTLKYWSIFLLTPPSACVLRPLPSHAIFYSSLLTLSPGLPISGSSAGRCSNTLSRRHPSRRQDSIHECMARKHEHFRSPFIFLATFLGPTSESSIQYRVGLAYSRMEGAGEYGLGREDQSEWNSVQVDGRR